MAVFSNNNEHVYLGTGHIRHLKKDFMNHVATRMYVDHKINLSDIAREYGICTHHIYKFFQRNGINTQDLRDGVEF